ncbi:MAG: phage tail protein [Cyanobacteria bacterium J06639_16]
MVQSLSPPSLSLALVPRRVPNVSLTYGTALSAASDDTAVAIPEITNLLLVPGEPSELLLRLANRTDQPLQLTVNISDSIPLAWCLTSLETYELAPQSRQEIAIAFQVPVDFFETLTDAAPGERRPLNYSGRIDVYSYTLNGDLEAINSDQLILAVRPTSPYLYLLPQVYQDIDVLGRLLAIAERTFTPDVETFNSLWAYLNPLLAPQAMLPFLAHWVGWRHLPALTWQQQRRLIHRAIELYSWRGTAYGLRLYLHLVTGLPLDDDDTPALQKHIDIVEPSRQGAVFGDSEFSPQTVFGGGQGFHFVVILRFPDDIEIDETLVRAIIDQERPAFCTYELYTIPMI